ncbi:MAG: acetylornithine deacetylase, partial [Gaiellales bacterium]|nr:acetylornithine deacetylase [Gaiellales bacterium]
MSEQWELLRRLVAFPSVAGRPNGEIAGFVRDWLRERDVACDVVAGNGGRVNLLAMRGPRDVAGVMLAAHMDVVPADADGWSGDPWRLEQSDDRLVARGSADMKGFLACAMAAIAGAGELSRPLHLAVSTDEEIGCVGVRDLLPAVQALPLLPFACVV